MASQPRVADIDRYHFVVSQLQYFNEKIIEVFSLFIKLATAVAGGVIWLRLQPDWPTIWPQVRWLAVSTVVMIAIASILMIGFNLRSWLGFRRTELQLVGQAVPPTTLPRSASQEILMTIVILASASVLVYALFNMP
jgi:hypothetical protein